MSMNKANWILAAVVVGLGVYRVTSSRNRAKALGSAPPQPKAIAGNVRPLTVTHRTIAPSAPMTRARIVGVVTQVMDEERPASASELITASVKRLWPGMAIHPEAKAVVAEIVLEEGIWRPREVAEKDPSEDRAPDGDQSPPALAAGPDLEAEATPDPPATETPKKRKKKGEGRK